MEQVFRLQDEQFQALIQKVGQKEVIRHTLLLSTLTPQCVYCYNADF